MDLAQELVGVRAELARVDGKANTLLGLAGTATSVAVALAALGATRLPLPAQVVLWVAVALLAAAVVVLLLTVRPALPRPGAGVGWVAHAYSTPAALQVAAQAEVERNQMAELIHLSRLTRAKYARLRTAVDLLLAALLMVPVVAATVLIIGGAS